MEVHMKRIGLLVTALLLTMTGLAIGQSNYFQFGGLNQNSVNVTSTWTRLITTTGTHSFTKSDNTSVIEVHVNSRFGGGTLSGGANGVRFQIRVDNATPAFENMGSLVTSNSSSFLSMYAVRRFSQFAGRCPYREYLGFNVAHGFGCRGVG
jgi:hypothetical protein